MTDDTPPDSPKRNPLMEEAALWFARMRGPDAEQHRPEFEAWLARGALHRAAYNRAGEIFSLGKFLEGEDFNPQPDDDVQADDGEQPDGGPARYGAGPRRIATLPLLVLGACIILVIGWAVLAHPVNIPGGSGQTVAGTVRQSRNDGQNAAVRFATGANATSERLSDGTVVALQPQSAVLVSFSDERRNLRLERGAARFDVAHEHRPFVVFAGGGSVTAKGTVFEVRIAPDLHVTVKLVRGSIDVAMPAVDARSGSIARLEPGQEISFGLPRPQAVASPVASDTSGAPPTIMPALREFDQVPLEQVIAQANATNATKIRLGDPRLAERLVSGRFRIDDPQKLADKLAWIFNAQVTRNEVGELVLSER